jgi:uncharacterized protein involved in type VI secretion and phage assembly
MQTTPADTSQYTLKVAGQQFQVLTLSTYEEVSQLFQFTVTVFADDAALGISQFLRQDAEIVLSWGGGKTRSFAGVVSSWSTASTRSASCPSCGSSASAPTAGSSRTSPPT